MRDVVRRTWRDSLVYLGVLGKRRPYTGPLFLQLQLPSSCDHDCVFCGSEIHGRGKILVKNAQGFQVYMKAIEEAVDLGTLDFNFVSLGEPLLYPGLKELIERTMSLTRGSGRVKIVTNGTSLHKLGLEFIKKHRVHLWVSLHAGDFETWEKIHRPLGNRGREKFEKLVDALVYLGANITLHNVMQKLNYNRLDSIVEFAKVCGARRIHFQPMLGYPEYQLNEQEEVELRAGLKHLLPICKELGIRNNILSYTKHVKGTTVSDFYRRNRCYMGWLWSQVKSDGSVTGCCLGKSIANLNETSFRDIWTKDFQSFRREGIEIRKRGNVPGCNCRECPQIALNGLVNRWVPGL